MLSFLASAWFKRIERLLLASSLLCLSYSLVVAMQARAARRASGRIHPARAASTVTTPQSGAAPTAQTGGTGPASVIGRLEIPSLKLSVPILSSDDSSSLLRGVGHVPGTAMPGGLGNVGLAGHRDMYLRPLKAIAPRMDIRVTGSTGIYHYQVDSTEIVTPDQVRVLDINSRPELTLITCYPFYYVGNAPKRFIVHAHLLSAIPEPID